MDQKHQTVLIIGAGIAGLALAQGLKKKGIPFLVFEKDSSADSRPQGWALTIHFSLPLLQEFLPADIANRLHTTRIDPVEGGDHSPSIFLNLATCTPKWSLPPSYGNRMRVLRGRLRSLLTEGIEERILWGKKLTSFESDPDGGGVKVRFGDGSCYSGELLVGVDGCHSAVRSLLYEPQVSQPEPIPACFLGTQALATAAQMEPLLALDKTLFQGCHPSKPAWMWFSVMERPKHREVPSAASSTTSSTASSTASSTTSSVSSTRDNPLWRVQICLSWLSPTDAAKIPITDTERIHVMRQISADFHPTFQNVFHDIAASSHGPVVNVPLEFWWLPPGAEKRCDSRGRVTLAGDAAHTMPLYRGEGFNHALMDVHKLLRAIDSLATNASSSQSVLSEYEDEVRSRGRRAALMCREACLEVHAFDQLGDHSVVRQKAFD